MDNRIGDIVTFLAVAREGSFAGAAKALRQTSSAVSRSIARTETRLGVVLFRRTTRSLALTSEGEIYRERMSALLAEMDEVEGSLGRDHKGPHGLLRISCSVPLGNLYLLPILPRFSARYPNVTIDLSLSDSVVDLVEARADIALRIGPLRSTTLTAKKLGTSPMVVVASPAYLESHGTPATPEDLDAHRCLQFSFRRSVDGWPFRLAGRVVHRAVESSFLGNSGEVVRMMAVAGGGIARLGYFHAAPNLERGELVRVLEGFNPGDTEDIHALCAARDRSVPRVRAFLDFLEEELRLPL